MAISEATTTPGAEVRQAVKNPYSALPNWLYPTFVVVALSLFGLFAIWVVFFQRDGYYAPYLSPFYSPYLKVDSIPPAIWVAWAPLAFRLTCYYYRKAYFRSFFWHPRSCAVAEPSRGKYRGETAFPWVFNNFHRFAFYATVLQVGFLWFDAIVAFDFGGHFGIGLGSVLMLVNVLLLSGYTFGCHAFRHLAGGGLDCFSCSEVSMARWRLWKGVTVLSIRHDRWAWASLVSVAMTDIYIRLLMHGWLTDLRWISCSSAPYETVETDVLVLGAGGAGLRGAIAAAQAGARVLVVCKSLLGKAHTVMAEGGVAAAMHNVAYQDSWEVHFADTMKGGKLINNWRMAELHAKESPERVLELERWGAVFDRTWQGRIHQRPFGAHTYPRLAHIGDRTGLELIRTLQDRAVHTAGVDVHMEVTVFKLLKSAGAIAGALAYRRSDGSLLLYRCSALLLASGGAGKMYRVTSNSWESTGDGTALAYDAGAQLRDMEMVQFHPTGMVWPAGVRGILVTEGVRGEGGVLRNKDGERFMERYDHERMELSSRDVVARAINSEVNAGRGSPHGGVFLDITHRRPEYIKTKLPSMYEQFLKLAKVDITRQPMEVAPTIHYAMGGVLVDAETAASTVPGLFAAGEVAGGLHGANRLGGNSLSDLLVFGKRAGDAAGAAAKESVTPAKARLDQRDIDESISALMAPLDRPSGESPYKLQVEIQEALTRYAPIVRDQAGLEAGLQAILELEARAGDCGTGGSRSLAFNPGWHTAIDIRSMLINAEALLRSALARKESRGAHARSDFPKTEDELGAINFVVEKSTDGMVVKTVRIPPMPEYLADAVRRSYARYTPEETE